MEEVDLARLSAISLPRIPAWLGDQKNLIVKLASLRKKRIFFMLRIRGKKQGLKG
jgi:hypothetical protein